MAMVMGPVLPQALGLARRLSKRQRGFSMVEVSMVIALTVMVTVIGVPAIQSYMIESRVPRVAEDIQQLVARMKVSAISMSGPAYGHAGQAALAANLRHAVAVRVLHEKQLVTHGLGGSGVGKSGIITMSPAALPGEGDGSAFTVVMTHVNHAACPTLATMLQRLAVRVLMSGKDAAVEVKNSVSSPQKDYDPLFADSLCQEGDNNTFEFLFR